MENNFYNTREFLNNEESDANSFISCTIDGTRGIGYSVVITDCHDRIHLHEYLDKPNALYKIDILVSSLTKLRERVEETQYLQKVCCKKYKSKETAELALAEIIDNPLLIKIKHQLEVFCNNKTFSIKRNFKKKSSKNVINKSK